MSPQRSLDLAADLLGVLIRLTNGRPISDPGWSETERLELERLGVLVRELLRRTVSAPAFQHALPVRDFDQINADGDRRYYFHGDLADAGTFYDARLDQFVLVVPQVTTIAHAGDLGRLKVQLAHAEGGRLPGPGFYRPDNAANVFVAHPLMRIPLRQLWVEAHEEGLAYLEIRASFSVERKQPMTAPAKSIRLGRSTVWGRS